jgi:hypothetical protein
MLALLWFGIRGVLLGSPLVLTPRVWQVSNS